MAEPLEYLHECEDVFQPPRKSPDQWTATTIAFEDAPQGEPRGKMVGLIEAYICTSCGYFEPYLKDYREIHWELVRRLSLLNPGQQRCATCDSPDLATLEQLGEQGGRRRLARVVRKLWWRFQYSALEGEIQGTLCRACGYLEQRLRDPTILPWETVVGLSWLSGERARCARCGGSQVGRLEGIGPRDSRFAMTKKRASRYWQQGLGWDKGPIPRDPGYVGQLGAEVCATCGIFVVLVHDPDSVPWDELAGFSMI